MKIGPFSEKNNVPVSTVRYYISEELLIPKKNGAQYDFDERNEREMQLLNELRQMNFSMDEMKKFISIIRMLDPRDELRYLRLRDVFEEKKKALMLQVKGLHDNINQIEAKMAQLKMEESVLAVKGHGKSSNNASGISTDFLTILRCPECGQSINLENIQIYENEILSGNLICRCGYKGTIENGIVNIDPEIDLDADETFVDDYFGESSAINQNYCIQYEGFLSAKTDFLNIQHRAREWIDDAIIDLGLSPKVVLFPDIASLFLYLHTDAEYLKNAKIIVMGISRKGVEASRRHLETIGADLKVMYVVSPSNRLPVKEKSIELVVDYLASFNYAFFYERPLYEYIDKYCSEQAVITGCTTHYPKGSASIKNIENNYTNSMKPFVTLSTVLDTMRNHGYQILAQDKIGHCTALTEFFDYHVTGELHQIYAFCAKRQ